MLVLTLLPRWIWGVYKDGKLCGHLELKDSEHTQLDELKIVCMIHPEERRKGVMQHVLNILKAKQHLWQRKVIATVAPEK